MEKISVLAPQEMPEAARRIESPYEVSLRVNSTCYGCASELCALDSVVYE